MNRLEGSDSLDATFQGNQEKYCNGNEHYIIDTSFQHLNKSEKVELLLGNTKGHQGGNQTEDNNADEYSHPGPERDDRTADKFRLAGRVVGNGGQLITNFTQTRGGKTFLDTPGQSLDRLDDQGRAQIPLWIKHCDNRVS